jgi:signal transduction histidine kinase/CheY-like chemotaxis protein
VTELVARRIAVIAGALLVACLILMAFAGPDPARHERVVNAARALVLNDAALQRDALESRAGLLPNYDPLVTDAVGLRDAMAELQRMGDNAVNAQLQPLTDAIDEQEAAVDAFKSDNALLQNSLRYLASAIAVIGVPDSDAGRQTMAGELGRLADAMLLFMHDPRLDSTLQVTGLLDRLSVLPVADTGLANELSLLIAHGRMIVRTLPVVDETLVRLVAVPTTERVRLLQSAYLEQHAGAEAVARLIRFLGYIAAGTLVSCLGYGFLRIWTRARALAERSRALESRLSFQGVVTEASARVATARHREDLDAAISRVIGQLGETRGVDRVYVALLDARGQPWEVTHWWDGLRASSRPDQHQTLLSLLRSGWVTRQMAESGHVAIASVTALPAGMEKTLLEQLGTAAWLCLPIHAAGRQLGFLGFDSMRDNTPWQEADIALVRTMGEVVANAIDRERAEAQRKELEAKLRQSEKMEAIGTFAGGIAHDFNNILGAILGYGEMALATLDTTSPARRHVQEVIVAGERAAALVGSILLFSRRGDDQRRPFQAQPVVEETIAMLRASLPPDTTIRAHLEAPDAAVLGNPTQLHQVVMTLCTNAAQAMGGAGVVDIKVEVVNVIKDRSQSSSLPAGQYLRLTVADTGCGMDEATMSRIFEPFFTTKASGSGTGLGLATAHGIVTEQGGRLEVRSNPGTGSTFDVYLPTTDAAAADDDQRNPLEATVGGQGEVILLVDDERSLMLLGEEMLASLGYEPVGFDNPRQALDAFHADPARFDMILSDAVMPGLSGLAFASEIHAVRPELPILMMTGYSEPIAKSTLDAAGVRAVLRKPLRTQDIASAVAMLQVSSPDTATVSTG